MTPASGRITKQARAAYIDRRLADLYPLTPVPLGHRDAFTLLIAVLSLAQCTDKRVNQITPRLFAWANNPAATAGGRKRRAIAIWPARQTSGGVYKCESAAAGYALERNC